MNSQLESFARKTLKDGLARCSPDSQEKFKLMYARGNLDMPIYDVVDAMPVEKLDWAMQQVENTLAHLKEACGKED